MSAATHAYVGRARCGHPIFWATDDGAASNAKEVASVIRRGGTIDRVTIEEARATMRSLCPCSKAERWRVR